MRKSSLMFLLGGVISMTCCPQKIQDRFVLKGELTGMKEGVLYLSYRNKDKNFINDSSVIVKGKFSFTDSITEPTMAGLTLKQKKETG